MFPKAIAWACYGVDRKARKFVVPALLALAREGVIRIGPGGRYTLTKP
jgi:hypothetical protein